MVWLKFIIIYFICIFSVNASELSQVEINYFEIIDLNNDNLISIEEINQTTAIIFQLIDINKDDKISLLELEELKEIIKIFK